MTLGNNPLTTTQSLGPVAQNITRGARVIPCTLWCHTGVAINLSTTVWFWAKNRYSHIFSRCRLKLVCSISFFSQVQALTNGLNYITIPSNRTKIQETPIFSTVVDKLIATPTNLIGHCFSFWSIAQLSDMLAIKFEGRRNPKTYAVLTVCFALIHPVFNKIFIASFCIFWAKLAIFSYKQKSFKVNWHTHKSNWTLPHFLTGYLVLRHAGNYIGGFRNSETYAVPTVCAILRVNE